MVTAGSGATPAAAAATAAAANAGGHKTITVSSQWVSGSSKFIGAKIVGQTPKAMPRPKPVSFRQERGLPAAERSTAGGVPNHPRTTPRPPCGEFEATVREIGSPVTAPTLRRVQAALRAALGHGCGRKRERNEPVLILEEPRVETCGEVSSAPSSVGGAHEPEGAPREGPKPLGGRPPCGAGRSFASRPKRRGVTTAPTGPARDPIPKKNGTGPVDRCRWHDQAANSGDLHLD